MAKNKRSLVITPGREALTSFMRKNGDLFNLTSMERLCKLPNGKLRHIRAGSRMIEKETYIKVQQVIGPKLCEFVFILQNNLELEDNTSLYLEADL